MTTVEWLSEQYTKQITFLHREDFQQAKEMEKEMLHQVWKASEQNMRSQFSSSAYKNITFEDHYEALRSKKY